MEFLKDIALPPSLEHFHLLVLLSVLSSIVFVPYICFVFGSSILSLWLNRKRYIKENGDFIKLSHVLIETVLYNKSLIMFLAILPSISLVLSYAQILQGTSSLGGSIEGLGFLFLLVGMILLYVYKYSFQVQELMDSYKQLQREQSSRASQEPAMGHQEGDTRAHLRSGKYGVFFLFIAIILYAEGITVASNPSQWDNDSLFSLLLSWNVWLKIMELLLLSIGITGIGMLFFSFAWNSTNKHTEGYALFVRKLGLRMSMIGLLTLPAFVLFNLSLLPDAALSGTLYSLTGLGMILFFLAAHFIYGYYRLPQRSALAVGFTLFLLATTILIASDSVAFGTAARSNAVLMASNHEKSIEELKSRLGVSTVMFTGEDIYNARCFACHLFDQKKVGPPYFETIPKYEGNKDKLIAFILSPTKVNPAFPPMPNQGLKPIEADSIASYILRKVAASFPASMK